MSIGVFVGLGTVLLTIGVLLIFGATRDPLLKFFDWIFNFTRTFINIMPKPLQILIFLFFLIFIVGSVFNAFLSILFFCNGDTVYHPNSFFTGVGIALGSTINANSEYGNLTNSELNSIISGNSVIYNSASDNTPEGLIQIQCQYEQPSLTIFGINIFNYRTWIFLFILGGLLILFFKMKR